MNKAEPQAGSIRILATCKKCTSEIISKPDGMEWVHVITRDALCPGQPIEEEAP